MKSFEKNSLNSLKLFTLGFTAPLKVPISYSKDFLISRTITSFCSINLSHSFGVKYFSLRDLVLNSIGTTSFLIFTLGFLNGIKSKREIFVTSNFLIFRVLKIKS